MISYAEVFFSAIFSETEKPTATECLLNELMLYICIHKLKLNLNNGILHFNYCHDACRYAGKRTAESKNG